MYHIDGDFGKVRLAENIGFPPAPDVLYTFTSLGWHKCNSKYRIARADGLPCHTLFFTLSGRGVLRAGAEEYELLPGSVAIAPPGGYLEYFAAGLWEFYWIHPFGGGTDRFLRYAAGLTGRVFYASDIGFYAHKVEQLLSICKLKSPVRDIDISEAICGILHRLLSETRGAGQDRSRLLTDEVVAYLEENYMDGVTLKDLSGRVFLTPAHLIRVFKAATGLAPYEYLTRFRVLKACQYLRYTDMQVKQIAKAVGFRSASNFIRHFRAVKGITPQEFRADGSR